VAESIAVLGAGMGGLYAALALGPTGRKITLYDRDPAPPAAGAEAAFGGWIRRGVGHLRHSHAFLARLRGLLSAEHPALLEALREAGAREITFADGLPPPMRGTYHAEPRDEELAVIVSRRTTLELVMRGYVESQANVEVKPEIFVRGLISEREASGALVARGLVLDGGETVSADVVIDAGGRASGVIDWLAQAGAPIEEESEDCAILYFTRFYRLAPGQAEPPRGRVAGTGDLGFLKFAVFPADNGTFSITLAAPQVEETLRAAIVRPDTFDRICAELPGVAPWTDPARATPISRVFGMGDLKSRWREMAPGGVPAILGLFSIGDSLAHLLRDVLDEHADTRRRATLYSQCVRTALRPYYDDMRAQDRAAARRALHALDAAYRPPWRARLMRRFVEDGVAIALRRDIGLYRQAMRGFHMLAPPRGWLSRPSVLIKILATWARGRAANAAFYAPAAGPGRGEMFASLGLAADADPARLRAATA
jgi:2-polyprenyl-6-methoxyphenol hydroxylase-like FAD-dependent oxidoreductase